MRTIVSVVFVGLVAGCGGADQPPAQSPPPPPPAPTAPVADTTPAPPASAAPAPAPKPTMLEMQAAYRKAFAASMGDAAKWAALYAPDATVVMAGFPDAKGRDAIQQSLQGWIDGNANMAEAIVRVWSKGNIAVDQWVTTGTDKKTGKPWGISGIEVLTFNDDGLITQDHTYFDYETLLKQTGQYKGQTPGRPILTLPTGEPEIHVAKGDEVESANVANENAVNAAWSKMDDRAALGFLADGVVMNDFTDDQPRDKKFMQESWVAVRKAMKDPTWKDWTLFGCEDFTIDEGEFTFTQTGDFVHGKVHIPSKKKTITGHNIEIDQWKDGKIVSSWNWSNQLEFDQQLGIGPAAAKAGAKDAKPADTKKDAKPAPDAKKDAAGAKPAKK